MAMLVLGLLVFFGIHSISIVADPWRNAMAQRLGEIPWKALYAVLSLAGFLLILKGYGAARLEPVVLYTPPSFLRHLAMLFMLPVFVFLLAAYLPGRIKGALKHPMLVATKLWATAHLLVNGTLADVLLFGSFLAWAVADRISVKRRPARPLPGPPPGMVNDIIAVAGGLGIYVAFVLWLHGSLIGIPLLTR